MTLRVITFCSLVLALLPASTLADLQYRIEADNTATLTNYTGGWEDITIPSTYWGVYPVTSIGEDAFYDSYLSGVIIPDSVTSIDRFAFSNCSILTNVIMGNGVTRIGYGAFNSCDRLESIQLGDGVDTIDALAFSSCLSLTNITISTNISYIDWYAFLSCWNLTSVRFEGDAPDYSIDIFNQSPNVIVYHLEGMGGWSNTFADRPTRIWVKEADGFTYSVSTNNTVTITGYIGPSGAGVIPSIIEELPVTTIGYRAFQTNSRLSSITIPDSVTYIGSRAFYGCTNLSYANFGTSVWGIGDRAYQNCTGLSRVTLPDSCTQIGFSAFANCSALTNAAIPANVTNIGTRAFTTCDNLTQLTVDPNNLTYRSTDGVLFNKSQTMLIQYPGGKSGDYTAPDGVLSINFYAFANCIGVTRVNLPDGVTSIGPSAFTNSSALISVLIPDSVTNIGSRAFTSCANLTEMTVDPNNSTYRSTDGVLFNKNHTLLIQLPGGKPGNYTVPDGVTSIEEYAFAYGVGLTALTLPDSVTSIGSSAFSECANLANTIIGNGATSIPNYAFRKCAKLTSLTLGNSISSVNQGSLSDCPSLKTVFCKGDAPPEKLYSSIFINSDQVIVYYRTGTVGWGETFNFRPTAIWPEVLSAEITLDGFMFDIIASENQDVVLEACPDLSTGDWTPVETNTISGAPLQIGVTDGLDLPSQYYRLVLP